MEKLLKSRLLGFVLTIAGFIALWMFLKHVAFVEPDYVKRQGVKVYVMDPGGTLWDVSQAEVSGLSPRHFVYEGAPNAPSGGFELLPVSAAGLPGDTMVLALADEAGAVAFVSSAVRDAGAVQSALGSKSILAMHNPATGEFHVYDASPGGAQLTIRMTGWVHKGVPVYEDEQGGMWYPERGGLVSVQGESLGRKLYEMDSTLLTLQQWAGQYPGSVLVK